MVGRSSGKQGLANKKPCISSQCQERSKAYLNVGVFHNNSLNTQWAKDVIAAYRSPEFKAYAMKRFPGYNYPAGWVK